MKISGFLFLIESQQIVKIENNEIISVVSFLNYFNKITKKNQKLTSPINITN